MTPQQETVCKNCGYIGLPKHTLPGHGLIEFLLWFCYLIPGLIYSAWRRKSAYNACPSCNAKEMIPTNSFIGRELTAKIRGGSPSEISSETTAPHAQATQPETPTGKQKTGMTKIILFIFLGFLGFQLISSMIEFTNEVGAMAQKAPALATPAPTGNIANNRFLALPEKERAQIFTKASHASGTDCNVKTTFYMGIGKKALAKDHAFWSIRCTNGNSYVVEIFPDSVGSSSIIECSTVKLLHAGECFKKFADQ